MELSESYQYEVKLQHQRTLNVDTSTRRTLSPQEQKNKLLRKIETLMVRNEVLKQKQDGLQNTIYDLRKLLQFVGKETLQESSELHHKNDCLTKKAQRMEQTLRFSHMEGEHLYECSMYWKQFVK